eukprot:gene7680-5385_t
MNCVGLDRRKMDQRRMMTYMCTCYVFNTLYECGDKNLCLLNSFSCLNEIMLEEDNTNEAICFSDGCRDPTAELQRLCASPSSISDTSLKELVEMGADVCCPIGSDKCPLLIVFAINRDISSFEICMEAINRIDFTLTDPVLGETILHIAARQPNGTCLKLAKMISDRTETRLDDKISLEILDADHKDALSVAGENGNVESMYQSFKNNADLNDRTEPLRLRCPCFESDVSKAKAFLPNGAPFFELTQPMLRANEATMQLLDLLREYFIILPSRCILNEFIFRGELEMVNCLLETPREMDMTVADTITQGTVFHEALSLHPSHPETIHGMLTALFRHAKQYHDTIDFSVRNRWGQDVWSCGAWHDVLSVLINCMRMERVSLSRVLPGEKREDPRTASELHNSSVAVEKILITAPLGPRDTKALTEEDKRWLLLRVLDLDAEFEKRREEVRKRNCVVKRRTRRTFRLYAKNDKSERCVAPQK